MLRGAKTLFWSSLSLTDDYLVSVWMKVHPEFCQIIVCEQFLLNFYRIDSNNNLSPITSFELLNHKKV